MNAPAQQYTAPAQKDARATREEMLEDFIAESAWSAGVACGLIQTYCEIKDHAAMVYSVRRLVAYAKAIAQTTNELTALKSSERADESAI